MYCICLSCHKNIRIRRPKKFGAPLFPPHFAIFKGTKGVFSKVVIGFQTFDMTYEGLGEMFVGDFADMCADKFLLVLNCWTCGPVE